MKIACIKNKGYSWTETERIFFKGYIQMADDEVLRGMEAISYFNDAATFEEFENKIRKIYGGLFCVIIKYGETVWASTDIYRSMPIYFSRDGKYISDSSEYIRKAGGYDKINNKQLLEMYCTGMIAFENTMYSDISQIPLGCVAELGEGHAERMKPYYNHYAATRPITREKAMEELDRRTNRMVERLMRVVGDREIVLSLSGGYDSRYLACSLKRNNVQNVTCFTYGIQGSMEIEPAKKVADALGYKFIYVEHTPEMVMSVLQDAECFEYCKEHDYSIYLQNYAAIKELAEKNLISKDAVILTGIWNDMPSGFYVPSDAEIGKYQLNNEGVSKFIVGKRFWLVKLKTTIYKSFRDDVRETLQKRNLKVNNKNTFVHVADCVMTENEHSRCYMHMNTIHEFFGYEYLCPALDRDLLEFWYSLPREMLYQRNLYEEYITERVGKEYGLTFKRKSNETARNPIVAKLKRRVGGILVKLLYTRGIPFKRNTDINGFASLEAAVCKRIVQKKAIVSEHANGAHLLTIYTMEKRYGTKWFDEIKPYIL